MAINFKFVQSQTFQLAGSGVSVGDGSMTLVNFNQINGVPLTMSDFGIVGYGTLEPGSGMNEEQISFTSVTINMDGTVTLGGIESVLDIYPYTGTSNFASDHAGGVAFVISNTAGFYGQFTIASNDETITGTWLVPDPTVPMQIANKEYVDALLAAVNNIKIDNTPNDGTYLTLTGAVDGTNTIFTTTTGYRSGTLSVSLDGLEQTPGTLYDFVELIPTAGTFQFNIAPPIGSRIIATYGESSSLGVVVNTVTGLNTDNTDPHNPIVKISVDDTSITGLGTPGSPLIAHTLVPYSYCIAVLNAEVSIGSSATETDIIPNTVVPGGSLTAGRAIEVKIFYTFTGSNTSTSNTYNLYYGGTNIASVTIQCPSTGSLMTGSANFTINYVGASSQYIGVFGLANPQVGATQTGNSEALNATSTIDSTINQNIRVTVHCTTAPGNSLSVNKVESCNVTLL